MSTYLEDEVDVIKHFKILEMERKGYVSIEDAAKRFTEKYAEKYEEIWYDGISQTEIRLRLFA